MQLSCLPVSLYAELTAGRRSLGEWFDFAAALGLDGADVSTLHLGSRRSREVAAVRRRAMDAGVRIAIVAAYSDFVCSAAADRARAQEDLRRWIDTAAELGAAAIRVTAGEMRDGVEERDALAWIADGLIDAAAFAQASGVRALFENHVRGAAWQRNDFTQPAGRFLQVVRRTRGSRVEILFDTANNLALDEDPAAILDAVADRIGAVHVSDIRQRGTFEPTVIGTGVSPIAGLLSRLVQLGFDGWISVEEASGAGERAFREAVAFTEAAWRGAGGAPRRA
jgi:sugar phosphate isomerase/epimerase